MQRIAFLLRLREGTEEAYDAAHANVWPEMLALLKRSGISEYSIFRRDQLLFLTMHVENFEETWARIEADPVNTRWQQAMAPYFAPLDATAAGRAVPHDAGNIFHALVLFCNNAIGYISIEDFDFDQSKD